MDRSRLPRIQGSFQRFIHKEALGAVLLIASLVVAMVWVNSPWGPAFLKASHAPIDVVTHWGEFALNPFKLVNDGLMTLFFLLVGLELKREFLAGELANPKHLALPLAAALGGSVVPIGIYLLVAGVAKAPLEGWAVPAATDIALAIGVLQLLGSRVPFAAKIFLTAFAILDDLISVLLLVLFFSKDIHFGPLSVFGGILVLLAICNRFRIQRLSVYLLLGAVMWFALHHAGIHATLAGVFLAVFVPVRTRIDRLGFVQRGRELLDRFQSADEAGKPVFLNKAQKTAIHSLRDTCEHVQSPLEQLEHALLPVVTFFILPVFTLLNGGVAIGGGTGGSEAASMGLIAAIVAGQVIGKPLGITLATLAVARVIGVKLPFTRRKLVGLGCLGGIGFTMATFLARLSFEDVELLQTAQLGILLGSTTAAVFGFLFIRTSRPAS